MADFLERLKKDVHATFPFREGESFDDWVARARQTAQHQREWLAMLLDNVIRDQQREVQAAKSAWIARTRLSFSPGDRKPCHICGKFQRVAHAHHVLPLSWQFERGYAYPDHAHVWLCPSHHAIMHLIIDTDDTRKLGRRAAEIISELDKNEYQIFMQLLGRTGDRRS